MNRILLDADVILDLFLDREPHSDAACQVLSLCEAGEIQAYVTPVICSNVYYILRQISSHDKVLKKLKGLLGILDVLSMDRDVVAYALDSGFRDFEDALQNFAATKSGFVSVILTRNVKDYRNSQLGVFTPQSYLKIRQ